MCPPVSPTRRSMSGGPSTSIPVTAAGMLLQNRPIDSHHHPTHLVAPAVPVALAEPGGHVLGEHAQRVHPVRHHAPVEHRVEVELVPGPRRQHALVRRPVVRAPLVLGERGVGLAGVVRLAEAGPGA